MEKGSILKRLKRRVESELTARNETSSWRKWLAAESRTNVELRTKQTDRIAAWPRKPLISILLPVFNIDEKFLRRCIESVINQSYDDWELCIADDKSTDPEVRIVLEEFSGKDERVKLVYRTENGNISAASNSALELATGEFCALLDHDDELAADALFFIADEIVRDPDVRMLYSDEDKIDETGRRSDPAFKPDWSRDLLYSVNYINHLSAFHTESLHAIGGFRLGFEGSQDYDLVLRFIEAIADQQICHISRILYHWRVIPGSIALAGAEKPYAHERARQALSEHFARIGTAATVEQTHFNLHRVRYDLPTKPRVSLILHSSDEASEHEWRKRADYPNLEIIHVKAADSFPASLNRAAETASGEVLCFVDRSLSPISENWLADIVGYASQPQIGAVGGKIVSSSGKVVDGGIVLGGARVCNIANELLDTNAPGRGARNRIVGNYSTVSIACFAIEKDLFSEMDGFDESHFPHALFDSDLCLRLGLKNLRTVFNPYAVFECERPAVQPVTDAEKAHFAAEWKDVIANDPFYNPNYSSANGRFDIKV